MAPRRRRRGSGDKSVGCMKASFDVIVIGAGHAGCEAAYAAARIGARYPEAFGLYERAIELYRAQDEPKRVAHVTADLGVTMW